MALCTFVLQSTGNVFPSEPQAAACGSWFHKLAAGNKLPVNHAPFEVTDRLNPVTGGLAGYLSQLSTALCNQRVVLNDGDLPLCTLSN